jgi:hypothetical protein
MTVDNAGTLQAFTAGSTGPVIQTQPFCFSCRWGLAVLLRVLIPKPEEPSTPLQARPLVRCNCGRFRLGC